MATFELHKTVSFTTSNPWVLSWMTHPTIAVWHTFPTFDAAIRGMNRVIRRNTREDWNL